jgi:16S rRNA processing protein RimM
MLKWEDMAVVGRIARAHGVRGQVIVNPETDFPDERFQPGAELFIERGGRVETLTVTTARFHRERPVIGIADVETMNDAEALAGRETRDGRTVGLVRDVEGTLTGSRLVVDGAGGEVLIPLVSAICTLVDPAAKRIVIDPPEGLIEANARG